MKKSVRPAVSKASGDRGKAEATSITGIGKSATKSCNPVSLSKVKLVMIHNASNLIRFILCLQNTWLNFLLPGEEQ